MASNRPIAVGLRQPTLRLIANAVLPVTLVAAMVGCGDPMSQPVAIVVTFDPNFSPPMSMNTGAIAGIAADIANDNQNAGVKFSCAPDQAPGECGSFTPPGGGNTDPACYQAPENVPTGGTVTVTATSVTDPTKSVSATINIVNGLGSSCQ